MADGKSCDTVESIVVRVDTDSGLSGWGEVCPIPHYLPAYADGVVPSIENMLPVLLGADPLGAEALSSAMDRWLPGHAYAKSALDMAFWDITGQDCAKPLFVLLGGRHADRLPLYHSITCIEPEEMARIATESYRSGIRQFQAKLGVDNDWQCDVARLRMVREAVGDGPLVYGDWNCGASRLDAIRVGLAVSDMDVMLEQPCGTLDDCSAVRSAVGLPMKVDELAHDTASLLQAHSLGCMDAVALKLSKFGGVSALRRARDLCLHLGPKLCIEDTWGNDIATAAALHVAASTTPSAVMNVCDLSGYVYPRLDPAAPKRDGGSISVPNGPGLGVNPDPDVLGEPIARFE